MNNQTPEKKNHLPDGSLEVHSIFYTIQGEGIFAGAPAIFVRLAGCNLQCPSCDTEYTASRAIFTPTRLVEAVEMLVPASYDKSRKPLVVITGGEPLRQNLRPFLELLLEAGFVPQIETNGTLDGDIPEDVFVICSPKTGSINPGLVPKIDALKYVLDADDMDDDDGLPLHALGHPAAPKVARPPENFEGVIYVQPIDVSMLRGGIAFDNMENWKHLQAAVNSAKKFGYMLCIQQHKIIGVD